MGLLIELNIYGQPRVYEMVMADSLPPVSAAGDDTVYMLKDSREIFYCRQKSRWYKFNSGIKSVESLPDAKSAVNHLFYCWKLNNRLYITYARDKWSLLPVKSELPLPCEILPDAAGAFPGIEYFLLGSGTKYITYDSQYWEEVATKSIVVDYLPEAETARKDSLYIVKSSADEWITYDNENWTYLSGGKMDQEVFVVEALPPVGDARKNCIYIIRSSNEEWITYNNGTWTLMVSGQVYVKKSSTIPQLVTSDIELNTNNKLFGVDKSFAPRLIAGLQVDSEGNQKMELGSSDIPMVVNHKIEGEETTKNIEVNYRTPEGIDKKDKLAYMSDVANVGQMRGVVISALTSLQLYEVFGVSFTNQGVGYAVGDIVFLNLPEADKQIYKAWVIVDSIGENGEILTFSLSSTGGFLQRDVVDNIPTSTSGTGSGAIVNVNLVQTAGSILADIPNPNPGDEAIVLIDETNYNESYDWLYADRNGDGIYNWVPIASRHDNQLVGDNTYVTVEDGIITLLPSKKSLIDNSVQLSGNQTIEGIKVFSNEIVGTVSQATQLKTARKINNIPFDGTADIDISFSYFPGDILTTTREGDPSLWLGYGIWVRVQGVLFGMPSGGAAGQSTGDGKITQIQLPQINLNGVAQAAGEHSHLTSPYIMNNYYTPGGTFNVVEKKSGIDGSITATSVNGSHTHSVLVALNPNPQEEFIPRGMTVFHWRLASLDDRAPQKMALAGIKSALEEKPVKGLKGHLQKMLWKFLLS